MYVSPKKGRQLTANTRYLMDRQNLVSQLIPGNRQTDFGLRANTS